MIKSEHAVFVTTEALKLSRGETELLADALDLVIGGDMAYVLVDLARFVSALGQLSAARATEIVKAMNGADTIPEYVAFQD
jgi:hypothetical protein